MLLVCIMLLLLPALAMAADQPVFNEAPQAPLSVITDYSVAILGIAVLMMMTMVVMAAAIYVVGQMFGTETRAKASVYAQGMLVAVGVSVAVIVVLFLFGSNILSGQTQIHGPNVVEQLIAMLFMIGRDFLVGLIIVMLVLAAAAYAIGQMFGSETRARASDWANTMLAGAILAAILYVVVFYIIDQLKAATFFGGSPVMEDVANAIFTVSMLVAVFILITYLISRFFKVPEWEAYLNVEMSNLMSSFLIVVFVLGMFAASKAISLEMSGGSYDSPPKAAIAYMQDTVADSAIKAAMDVYKINACASILSTFSRRIGEFVLTQTYKVFPGLDTFVSITNALAFPIVTVYNTIMVQVSLLYFIDVTMWSFFLPAGLALRFFPPTRDAGAFIISLAIGLQIIFPTTYIINKQVFEDIGAKPYCSKTVPGAPCPTLLIQSLCGPFKYGFWGYLLNTNANPVFKLLPGAKGFGDTLARFVSEGLLNAASMSEFIPIMRYVAELSLIGLFMPALSMMITIAFINAMTKFIVAKV